MSSGDYPVSFTVDYAQNRNRLTSFFRLIIAIPILIWVALYALVAEIALVFAWLAIVFTGKYPEGLYNFISGYVRLSAEATAYSALLTDQYPPFSAADQSYPVKMSFAPLSTYSRMKTLFRIILLIPIIVVRYVMSLLLNIGAFAAWVVILFTGKMPRGLFDVMVLANSYMARSDAYALLLTESYPPFQDEETRAAGIPGS